MTISDLMNGLRKELRKLVYELLKEVVLEVFVEQERIRDHGACRMFIAECHIAGIHPTIDADGKLHLDHPERLSTSLKAVLTVYREPIEVHLWRLRDKEEHERKRYERYLVLKDAKQKSGNANGRTP